jgi:hypothetical protein
MSDPIRWAGVVALVVPVVVLLVWSWRMAWLTDQAMAEEARQKAKRMAMQQHVWGQIAEIQDQIAERLRFPSEEHHIVLGDVPAVPEPSEAMAQLRAVMAGAVIRCGVCHGHAPDLFQVKFTDNAVFACGPCAALFKHGAHG